MIGQAASQGSPDARPSEASPRIATADNPIIGRDHRHGSALNPGCDAVPGDDLSGWSPMGHEKPLSTLGPDDHVMWQGMRMPAKVAERLGYVERVLGAGYRPTGSAQAEAATRQAERRTAQAAARSDAGSLALSDEDAQLLDRLTDTLPGEVQSAVFADMTSGQGLSARSIETAAHHLGVSPQEALAALDRASAALSDQLGRVMEREGVTSADDFAAWVKANRREDALQSAQRLHLNTGQLDGYRGLAQAYMRDTRDRRQRDYAGAEMPAGYKVRMVDNDAVVRMPGYPEMTVDVARKLGLLGVAVA